MTTHQSFKRVVRARMAKTGERYAAARRALIAERPPADAAKRRGRRRQAGYRLPRRPAAAHGGLTNVLAASRRPVPADRRAADRGDDPRHRRRPRRGLHPVGVRVTRRRGADARLRQSLAVPGHPGLDRHDARAPGPGPRTCIETGGAKGAATTLDGILATGDPVIAYVDQQVIGTWGQPEALSGMQGYPVVIAGRRDDGRYEVDDRGRAPLLVDAATMAAARGRIGSFKHRLVHVRAPGGRADRGPAAGGRPCRARRPGGAPATAVGLVLAAGVAQVGPPPDRRTATPRPGRGSSPTALACSGRSSRSSRASTTASGRPAGTCASCTRRRSTRRPRCSTDRPCPTRPPRGERPQTCWEDLADAAVPPDLDGLEAIAAAERLHDAVMEGEPGRARATAAARELWARRDAYGERFPADADRVTTLLEDLGQRIGEIHLAEVEAIERLGRAIDR